MTRELIETCLGVASILESRRSLQETTDVNRLTKLGMTFLPLSFASGLLSMGGAFLPGEKHFWIYFVLVVPLIAVVFAAAYFWKMVPSPTGKNDGKGREKYGKFGKERSGLLKMKAWNRSEKEASKSV